MAFSLKLGLAWQTLQSDNLGVCALARANLAIAEAAAVRAGVQLDCMEFCSSSNDSPKSGQFAIPLADPLSPKRMLLGKSNHRQQVRSRHVMLDIGEGDSFADIYGLKRFLLLSFSKWLVISSGVQLVISPQTIGPFSSRLSQVVSRWLISRATRVFARDGLSMGYLRARGLTHNADEVIDVAFRLPFGAQVAPSDGQIHVGVNVSGLLYNGGYTRNNQFALTVDYPHLIDSLLAALATRPDVTVHLVGHVISDSFEVEDDYRVCQTLAARHPGMRLAPRFTSPSEAKSYISGLHFFTGARMHACIGAFSSGVPVVPMAYSRKFNGLFSSLGYHHLADLKAHDTETALQHVLQGLDRRQALAVEVRAGNALAQQKLQRYEDYLVELFGAVRDRAH